MLRRAELLELVHELSASHVLSVYIDGVVADPSDRYRWQTHVERELREVRRRMWNASHTERAAFESAVSHLRKAFDAFPGAVGSPGWVAFITAERTWFTEALPVQMQTLVLWDVGIHVAPYIRAVGELRPAIVVLVDAKVADIYRLHEGALSRVERIHAHHPIEQTLHMGNAPQRGFHGGTHGATGKEQAARAHEEGTERMQREVTQRVTDLAGATAVALVAGTPRGRADLATRLTEQLPDRVLELTSIDIHATESTLAAAATDGLALLRQQADAREVDSLVHLEGARGRAALGPIATQHALEQEAVQALYLTSAYRDARDAEAEQMIRMALEQAALVVEVEGPSAERLDSCGGVGARLRYRTDTPVALAGVT